MGFSILAALTIMASFILIASSLILQFKFDASNQIWESVKESMAHEEYRGKEKIRMPNENVTVNSDGTQIRFIVWNTGMKSIKVDEFSLMDVVIVYTLQANGSKVALWLEYSKSAGERKWNVEYIYTGNSLGEAINPINVTESSGHWDPNEGLGILITLPYADRADVNGPITILLATPSGVSSTCSKV
jgi:archaellum component FlaF (FlaF/FlaG flagellin family)